MDIEIEKVYLAKGLPPDLSQYKSLDYIDTYVPFSDPHPHLRLRKKGEERELTKKIMITATDKSTTQEITMPLSALEYDELVTIQGKKIIKRRYFVPVNNRIAEVDIFLDKLKGLVLIDFEFPSALERDSFVAPDFCLADVTQEEFVAGAYLAGKSFADLKEFLARFHYTPLSFPAWAQAPRLNPQVIL